MAPCPIRVDHDDLSGLDKSTFAAACTGGVLRVRSPLRVKRQESVRGHVRRANPLQAVPWTSLFLRSPVSWQLSDPSTHSRTKSPGSNHGCRPVAARNSRALCHAQMYLSHLSHLLRPSRRPQQPLSSVSMQNTPCCLCGLLNTASQKSKAVLGQPITVVAASGCISLIL
jgi:hypothetical protein